MNTATLAPRPSALTRVVVEAVSEDMAIREALVRRSAGRMNYRVEVRPSATVAGSWDVCHVMR
jgi:hypothetical protein